MMVLLMPQNKTKQDNAQSGNVFVIIFIAVVLFGALGYTFSKSANKGTGNLTKQQAKIAAQNLIEYSNLVEAAIGRVRRNGCAESQISFENSVEGGYSNTGSPANFSCHIFNDNGGKSNFKVFPKSYYDPNFSTLTHYDGWLTSGKPVFFNGTCVQNIGQNCFGNDLENRLYSELLLYHFYLNKDICIQINNLLGVDNQPSGDPPKASHRFASITSTKYRGSFTRFVHGMSPESYTNGKYSYCVKGPNTGFPSYGYHYYHTLLAR